MPSNEWYLLQTKARDELRAKENLENQSITTFCPQIDLEKIVRGKRKAVTEVLFPGYIFIQVNEQSPSFTTIRSTRGVAKFVSFGGEPSPVPNELIELIQQRITNNDMDEPNKNVPQKGDKLEITEGPFKGLEAIFTQPDGDMRAIVLVTVMSQLVPTSIANQHLKKR